VPSPDDSIVADADAIARTLAGDRQAFGAVVLRHQAAVYGLMRRMTASAEDAEDLTQETFVKAYRALGRFDVKRPFRPWILRIAVNAAHEHARRRHRQLLISLEDEMALSHEPEDPSPEPDEKHAETQRIDLLRAASDRLRGEHAALFHLHYQQDLGVDAIAEALGKRPNTIAVALHRLRDQLRRLVNETLKPEERS